MELFFLKGILKEVIGNHFVEEKEHQLQNNCCKWNNFSATNLTWDKSVEEIVFSWEIDPLPTYENFMIT